MYPGISVTGFILVINREIFYAYIVESDFFAIFFFEVSGDFSAGEDGTESRKRISQFGCPVSATCGMKRASFSKRRLTITLLPFRSDITFTEALNRGHM